MDTFQYVQLPDGSWAAVERIVSWGDAVIILLLAALVGLELYQLWRSTRLS